jgi:hypothetical protein
MDGRKEGHQGRKDRTEGKKRKEGCQGRLSRKEGRKVIKEGRKEGYQGRKGSKERKFPRKVIKEGRTDGSKEGRKDGRKDGRKEGRLSRKEGYQGRKVIKEGRKEGNGRSPRQMCGGMANVVEKNVFLHSLVPSLFSQHLAFSPVSSSLSLLPRGEHYPPHRAKRNTPLVSESISSFRIAPPSAQK